MNNTRASTEIKHLRDAPLAAFVRRAAVPTLQSILGHVAEDTLTELGDGTLAKAVATVSAAYTSNGHEPGTGDATLAPVHDAVWSEHVRRLERADDPGHKDGILAGRHIAARMVNLARMAKAIDQDDGIVAARQAVPIEGGRAQFDHLTGTEQGTKAARSYVAMRQAQRAGDTARVRTGAALVYLAEIGAINHQDVLEALGHNGLTKRMRKGECTPRASEQSEQDAGANISDPPS